ncbi:MAG: hypothetical protein EpisKO_41470 [Epibacterium sp.]
MLNRRGILRLMGGGVAAGAAVDPKEIVAEVMSKGGIAAGVSGVGNDTSGQVGTCPPTYDPVDRLLSSFWDQTEARHQAATAMPTHIANKKSWSPAFKQSEAFKEAYQIILARRQLERNRSLAEKVAKKFGFG